MRLPIQIAALQWSIAKPPFGGPQQVLTYLGHYTHRVAIANSRLVSADDGQVTFRWRDYRHHGRVKLMLLAAEEFIRRFLLHSLPDGFYRIRHYGFLANRQRAEKLALCCRLLAASPVPASDGDPPRYRTTAAAFDLCPLVWRSDGHPQHRALAAFCQPSGQRVKSATLQYFASASEV